MRFCPNCENVLIPRNKKLYCKVCNQEFELRTNCFDEYTIFLTIRHEVDLSMPIIIKDNQKNGNVSNELRKAYEDCFGNTTY